MEFREDDKKRLDKAYSFLFGNGEQGADDRMRNMELYIEMQEKRHNEERKEKRQLMIGLILTVLASLTGAIITVLTK